jgi:predicted nucleic acid-binding protein
MQLVDTNILSELMRAQPAAGVLAWLQRHEVLPITTDVARCAGALRGQLQLRGQTRSQADMLIAATAQIHALTIVTRNVRDFDGCGVAVLNPFAC